MDPVSAAASLITLIDLTFKTFKVIKKLAHNYHHAPAEMKDLRYRLDGLNISMILLRHVQVAVSNNQSALNLNCDDFETLRQSLIATSVIFSEIQSFLETNEMNVMKEGRATRLKWVLRDRSKVREWEMRLRRHANDLQNTLLLLNNLYSSLFESEFKTVKDASKLQSRQLNSLLSTNAARFSWARSVFGSTWILPYIAKVSPTRTELGLKSVVPADSMIMVACQAGDTSLVCNLLNERKASVNDITPDNFPPLSYAIESGSINLLELLKCKGADPKRSFGRFQTSPLDWALAHRQYSVARWLVYNGIDIHHVSARGWTPVFSLFGAEPCHQDSCEEYLELLSAKSFSDFNAQDGEGWSALHRAAAFGNANHVKSLISRGACLTVRTTKLAWTPIFCAVQFNNISTFNELRKLHSNFLTETDMRGWTLLHLAINSKGLDIMRLLICLGADPHARSSCTQLFIPSDLKGLSITPGDVASFRGAAVFSAYVDALVDNGHDIHTIKDEKEDAFDIFWPAFEEFTKANL